MIPAYIRVIAWNAAGGGGMSERLGRSRRARRRQRERPHVATTNLEEGETDEREEVCRDESFV